MLNCATLAVREGPERSGVDLFFHHGNCATVLVHDPRGEGLIMKKKVKSHGNFCLLTFGLVPSLRSTVIATRGEWITIETATVLVGF